MQTILDSYDEHVIALAIHVDNYDESRRICTPGYILSEEEGDNLIEALDQAKKYIDDWDYLSLTDKEADEAEDERLESYIDECILSEIPEPYRSYFDSTSWKRDARMDGRGHIISSYDGDEHEQVYNGTTYFIYRNRK